MMITPDRIAAAIHDAPTWAKLALTAQGQSLRDDAALEVAQHLYDTLYQPISIETAQLPLPLG